MKSDVRWMKRCEFKRITGSSLIFRRVETDEFTGYAGLMDVTGVSEPWTVKSAIGEVVIADKGYTWLQLSPDDEGWWLTVMYDVSGNIVQYYFDIVSERFLDEEGVPGFNDMYLDVVLNPGGKWVLLDMDELVAALADGKINKNEYMTAVERAENLISQVDGKEQVWHKLCDRICEQIKRGEV